MREPRVKPEVNRQEPSLLAASSKAGPRPAWDMSLWEKFLSRDNLARALRRVEQNAGAPGIDGMRTDELRGWLKSNWLRVRQKLDAGTYKPEPVRRAWVPKPAGGQRPLGVPTALDRLIQQALLQVLTSLFDPHFADESYGFRPGRSAHQAVKAARDHITVGYGWAVDLDLDSFFDRVNHDMLMARIARKVKDKQVLKLIRSYLNAGVMAEGVKQKTEVGTPQGSPLSPLLANVMLDDLDRELGRRGHRFVRYADDLMIYVRSQRAATRVMASVARYTEKRLKLKVNQGKTAAAEATKRSFLGFGFFYGKDGKVKVSVSAKSKQRAKQRLKKLTGRSRGISMERRLDAINRFTVGWTAYFALADTPSIFAQLDGWLRRRLRQVRWKEWKRIKTRHRKLRALGIDDQKAREWAGSRRGYWRVAGSWILQRALPNAYWDEMGLKGFSGPYRRFRDKLRTARCGPACRVVWEGPG